MFQSQNPASAQPWCAPVQHPGLQSTAAAAAGAQAAAAGPADSPASPAGRTAALPETQPGSAGVQKVQTGC